MYIPLAQRGNSHLAYSCNRTTSWFLEPINWCAREEAYDCQPHEYGRDAKAQPPSYIVLDPNQKAAWYESTNVYWKIEPVKERCLLDSLSWICIIKLIRSKGWDTWLNSTSTQGNQIKTKKKDSILKRACWWAEGSFTGRRLGMSTGTDAERVSIAIPYN